MTSVARGSYCVIPHRARYLLEGKADDEMLAKLDKRLQYGPGMRAQRLAEGLFLVLAFFTGDIRFAYVTLVSSVLQALSPRLVPVALVVAAFTRLPKEHRLSDLYFDFAGTRGACAISVVVQVVGLALVRSGHDLPGYAMLALPTASLILAPTVGFCCGCAVYVGLRDLLARAGLVKRYANGACDIDIDTEEAAGRQ
jgi:hypothetical protein